MADDRIRIRDRRKRQWFRIDNVIVEEYGPLLGPYGLAAYCGILKHETDATTTVSIGHLCRDTGMGRSSMQKAIEKLERLDLIEVIERIDDDGGQHSSEYLVLDVLPIPRPDWETRARPERTRMDTRGGVPHKRGGVCDTNGGGFATQPTPIRVTDPPRLPHNDIEENPSEENPSEEEWPHEKKLGLVQKIDNFVLSTRPRRLRDLFEQGLITGEELDQARTDWFVRGKLKRHQLA